MAIDSVAGRCVNAGIAAGLSPAAALFHSLADETRLRIVRRLARGEARYRAEGRQSFYSLTRPELMDLLASAEHLLAATGHAVALCPAHAGSPLAEGEAVS
jgi:ArsR family transcriptional regulator